MLIMILMFISSKIFHSHNFGQILSQNLIFSKLTEIWCKGTFLYADYGFGVKFFKIFAVYKFLGQISSQNLLLSIFTET